MPFDFSALRGRIIAKFGTCGAFAAQFGKGKSWISSKLRNVTPWTGPEIDKSCELLDIPHDEIGAYFFKPKFQK